MSPQICQMASYLFACFVLTAIPERDSRRSLASQTNLRSCRHCALTFCEAQGPLKMNRQLTFWAAKRRLNTRLPREGGEEEKAVDGSVAYKYEENEEQAAAEH